MLHSPTMASTGRAAGDVADADDSSPMPMALDGDGDGDGPPSGGTGSRPRRTKKVATKRKRPPADGGSSGGSSCADGGDLGSGPAPLDLPVPVPVPAHVPAHAHAPPGGEEYEESEPADRTSTGPARGGAAAGPAPGPGAARRRTKKARSARRLAAVSMPRTGEVLRRPTPAPAPLALAGPLPPPPPPQVRQHSHPRPAARFQGVAPAGIAGQAAWNPALGAYGFPPPLAQFQQQLLQQLQAHNQYYRPHLWPQAAPPGPPGQKQHGTGGQDAKAPQKANPGAKKAPPKRSAPATLDRVLAPSRPKEVVRREQPKRVLAGLVIPTGLEETVSQAASLVAAEIRSGCWVRQWADSLRIVDGYGGGPLETSQVESSRIAALSAAAAALERFAMEIVLPTFVATGVEEGPGGDPALDAPSRSHHNRTLAGTFLALREVLMINSDSYFFDVGRSDKDRCDSNSSGVPIGRSAHEAEETVLRSRLIASGVLFAAVNRLDEICRESVLVELITAIGEYDAAEDAFVLCLERADARSLGVLPNGRILGREENIAWRVSFNYARDNHPLITTKKRRDLARRLASYSSCASDKQTSALAESIVDNVTHRLELPKPNACAIYFVNGTAS